MKNQKGITLIALVITIIVLLILAAVSISAIVGEDGITNRAQDAKDKSAIATEKEQINLAYSACKVGNANTKEEGLKAPVEASELQTEMDKSYGTGKVSVSGESTNLLVQYLDSKRTYMIMQNGKSVIDVTNAFKGNANGPIGIAEDGSEVDLSNWHYQYFSNWYGEEDIGGYSLSTGGTNFSTGYIGKIVNGRIEGKMPAYILIDPEGKSDNPEDTKLLPVLYLHDTFSGLTELEYPPEIPSTVKLLSYTFSGCTNLKEAPVIPEGVIDLEFTFSNCTSLINAPVIPKSVQLLYGTFADCTSLKIPEIPENIKNISYLFSGCTQIVNPPRIPDGVEYMNGTFARCANLKEAPVIPNSVKEISSIFSGCTSLTKPPIIPDTVTSIDSAFQNCTNLTEAPILPNNITGLRNTFKNCTSLTKSPQLPNNVTDMYSTFEGCTSLTEVSQLPSSAKKMEFTFKNCTSLTEVPALPNNVETLYWTFSGCTNLQKAPTIPSSVKNIQRCFYECTNLTGRLVINATGVNTSNSYYYAECFTNAATSDGCSLVLVGSGSNSSIINTLYNTKSSNSKITKGS